MSYCTTCLKLGSWDGRRQIICNNWKQTSKRHTSPNHQNGNTNTNRKHKHKQIICNNWKWTSKRHTSPSIKQNETQIYSQWQELNGSEERHTLKNTLKNLIKSKCNKKKQTRDAYYQIVCNKDGNWRPYFRENCQCGLNIQCKLDIFCVIIINVGGKCTKWLRPVSRVSGVLDVTKLAVSNTYSICQQRFVTKLADW